MAITAPGMRPASMSAFSVSPIRASRSLESPTSSGFARGNDSWANAGSPANAAPHASRHSVVATIRNAGMDVSRAGTAAPDDCAQDYGNAFAETSAVVGHSPKLAKFIAPAHHRLIKIL